MNEGKAPTSIAASIKVLVEAIRTIFGAAIVVLIFFGLALVILCLGWGNLEANVRGELIFTLIYIMLGILAALVLLKVFKPSGLAGVSNPESKSVSFSNSQIES